MEPCPPKPSVVTLKFKRPKFRVNACGGFPEQPTAAGNIVTPAYTAADNRMKSRLDMGYFFSMFFVY